MAARGWIRAPGLRPRLVAALVLTSGVTIAVAALALLNPLEHRLRQDELRSLVGNTIASRAVFGDLDDIDSPQRLLAVRRTVRALARRTAARVFLVDAAGRTVADSDADAPRDTLPDLARSRLTHRPVAGIRETSAGGIAQVAVPVSIARRPYTVVLRRPLTEVRAAVDEVDRAVVKAAIAGLAIALVLGLGLATTLLRRLRRLRDAAAGLVAGGLDAPPPRVGGRDEVGDLARALATMHEGLRRQEEARRAFVATASHELRTPLTALGTQLELLAEDLEGSSPDLGDARDQVVRARLQSARLASLATELLDLSRLDAGVELRREPVELGELCRAVIAEFDGTAGDGANGSGSLRLIGTEPRWAEADPGAAARIIRILIDNARAYAPAGEPIDVTVAGDADRPAVTVTDRGPGVRPAERELIFERFHRGSAARAAGGFGLGLAIGRELARRLGGDLKLASAERGATFELVLRPMAADHEPAA